MDFSQYFHRRKEVDLNYLYHRHQVSLFMSENAGCDRSREAHAALAEAYAAKIEDARRPRPELVA